MLISGPLLYSKVSEKHACKLAAAMHRELEASNPIESSEFIQRLERLHSTGHANRLPTVLKDFGLQADVRVSYTDIGLKSAHPTLRMRDLIGAFNTAGKIHHLLAGNSPAHLQEFWMKYKSVAGHDAFTTHKDRFHCCLPMMLHLDEGTSHKKKGLMILSAQIVRGKGSKRNIEHNFLGSSYLSRYLFSVLLARTYLRKKAILYNLLEAWASDLKECYENGIPVENVPGMDKIYPVIIACKGDWPALTKAGRLCRHHLRDSRGDTDSPPGICHLCRVAKRTSTGMNFALMHAGSMLTIPYHGRLHRPCQKFRRTRMTLLAFMLLTFFMFVIKGLWLTMLLRRSYLAKLSIFFMCRFVPLENSIANFANPIQLR